jgi:bile acid:Na+ symporter, BASS family
LLIRGLEWMQRRSALLLAASLFVGLISQDLAALCKPVLPVSVFLLFVATALQLDWAEVFRRLRSPVKPLLIVAAVLVLAPLAMQKTVQGLGLPEFLHEPLVLLASSPPLISVPAFALLVGLDGPLALVVMVASSLLQPFVQPPVALALVGVKLDIGLAPLMLRLALFVGGAFATAAVLRAIAGKARIQRHRASFGGMVVLMLVIFAVGIMDGQRDRLLAEPAHVLIAFAAVFAANVGLQALGILVFWAAARLWRFTPREGLTAALVLGTRNLATLVAVLGQSASPDLLLVLACNQFPMYLIPSLGGPVYRGLLRQRR